MSEGVWGRSTGTGTIAAFSCSSANTPSPIEISHRSPSQIPSPISGMFANIRLTVRSHPPIPSQRTSPRPSPACDPYSEGTTTL